MIQVPLDTALVIESAALHQFEKDREHLEQLPHQTLIDRKAEYLQWLSTIPKPILAAKLQPNPVDKTVLQRLVDLAIIQRLLTGTSALR